MADPRIPGPLPPLTAPEEPGVPDQPTPAAERLQAGLERLARGDGPTTVPPGADAGPAAGPSRDPAERGEPALPAASADAAALLALARRMSEVLPAEAPPAFRARLQAELQTAFAAQAGATRGRARPAWSRRLLPWLVAACVALALALGGTLRVSADSLPGDRLYGVKRAAERLRLAVTIGAASRAALALQLAELRAREIGALAEAERPVDPALLAAVVAAYDEAARATGASGDAALAAVLGASAERAAQDLTSLAERADPELRRDLRAASERIEASGSGVDEGAAAPSAVAASPVPEASPSPPGVEPADAAAGAPAGGTAQGPAERPAAGTPPPEPSGTARLRPLDARQTAIATRVQPLATRQAGVATQRAGSATRQAGAATQRAGSATRQAGAATRQAGVATRRAATQAPVTSPREDTPAPPPTSEVERVNPEATRRAQMLTQERPARQTEAAARRTEAAERRATPRPPDPTEAPARPQRTPAPSDPNPRATEPPPPTEPSPPPLGQPTPPPPDPLRPVAPSPEPRP